MHDGSDVNDLHCLMLRQENAGSLGAGQRKVDGFNFARDPRKAQQKNYRECTIESSERICES